MIINATKSRIPLDLPELRHRISQFVAIKDALSCALVCKAWSADFIFVIWRTVHLMEQPKFALLSTDIISKYGHHIRVVIGMDRDKQIYLLNNPAVNGLVELRIQFASILDVLIENYAGICEMIQRNTLALRNCIDFFNNLLSKLSNDLPPWKTLNSVFFPALDKPQLKISVLTELILVGVCLTHQDFTKILEVCPVLNELILDNVQMDRFATRFKHTNLKRLGGSIERIFPQQTPSLLSYFPNLDFVDVWTDSPLTPIPTDQIKADMAEYCPKLTEYGLRDNDNFIIHFCTHIIKNPTHVRFDFDFISAKVINAILLHRDSLKAFYIYALNQPKIWPVTTDDDLGAIQGYNHLLQQIPSSCPRLEKLDLPYCGMEMLMDDIEEGEWVCRDLTTLRIRIKELDTEEKIAKAIELWRSVSRERWRKQAVGYKDAKERRKEKEHSEKDDTHDKDVNVKNQKNKMEGKSEMEEKDKESEETKSIEARVARHLFKFEKLQRVSLGSHTWSLLKQMPLTLGDMITTRAPLRTPFAIPELRRRISRFIPVKNAVSCALVCKAWTADFISVVWYRINFEEHSKFINLSPDIVSNCWAWDNVIQTHSAQDLEWSASSIFLINNSTILMYFPNLTYWGIFAKESSLPTGTYYNIARYCPHLTEYGFEDQYSFIAYLSNYSIQNFTRIRLDLNDLSVNLIDDILLHRSTLKDISIYAINNHFHFGADEVTEVSYKFTRWGDLLQLIPRSCPRLEILNLHVHEMDMDDLNCGEQDLEYGVGDKKMEDTSIEARVARHLLKFEKLEKVWLGYQTWSVVGR
ncbi:hypothetical protein FBU30_000871 [Linnemannia zychae]|nr:hypothetical protein FBU30_000871 [Linnemannia zychae]